MEKLPFETTDRKEVIELLKDHGEYPELAEYIVSWSWKSPNALVATTLWQGKVLLTFDGVKFRVEKEGKCLEENQVVEEVS